MKPTNRKEMFMEALANGCACPVEPVTREEKFLAAQARREAGGGADWNQNDPTAPDYVKNRTHYAEEEVIAERQTVKRDTKAVLAHEFVEGQTYEVIWDDRPYICKAWYTGETYGSNVVLGKGALDDMFLSGFAGENVPFLFYADGYICCNDSVNHTVSITHEAVHTIDPKYIKDMYYSDEEVILERQTVTNGAPIEYSLISGHTYKVKFDETTYTCTAWGNGGKVCLGDGGFWEIPAGEPAPFLIANGCIAIDGDSSAKHTVEIKSETIHRLDAKYLPCDLMFNVGFSQAGDPVWCPGFMQKPSIISGSLEAVLEKLANGEIPVVKVRYQSYSNNGSVVVGCGGEFTCHTMIYNNAVTFAHDIPAPDSKITMVINMNLDEPDFMEMLRYASALQSSPMVIE